LLPTRWKYSPEIVNRSINCSSGVGAPAASLVLASTGNNAWYSFKAGSGLLVGARPSKRWKSL
jgi:hypothetical protein